MCICCCFTRNSLIIYGIVITGIAFIYEISVISNFGSRTEIYKILMEEIEEFENNIDQKINHNFYKLHYGMIKRLKGIENGFVIPFFIFTLIFLAAEIVYLYFACGNGEYQLLKEKTYKVLNILKIIILSFFQ